MYCCLMVLLKLALADVAILTDTITHLKVRGDESKYMRWGAETDHMLRNKLGIGGAESSTIVILVF